MHRVPVLWIVLITLLAAGLVPAAQSAEDGHAARALHYRDALADLPVLQNSDGGWGRPVQVENRTGYGTTPAPEAFVETVLTVDLLLAEATDPYATTTNWEGHATSLLASNVSNAARWLHAYEAEHADTLSPGHHALGALAYAELQDPGNAGRVLAAQLESAGGTSWATVDLAMLLYAHHRVAPAYNESQNTTLAALEADLAGRSPGTLDGLAWSLLARPDLESARDALTAAVSEQPDADLVSLALSAWSLASADELDPADDLLVALYERAPAGLARILALHAEVMTHPEFSPNAPELPLVQGVADVASRAGTGPTISNSPAPAEPVATVESAPAGDGTAFPLPVWLMAAIILVAVSILLVVGLAYGLKRENLDGSRREIFTYIEKNPGTHFSKIRRDLGYAPGTFQHHLSVLESEGWITSHKESRYKRYFVNGNRYQKLIAGYTYKQRFAALANETTRSFVSYLKDHPGATQKQVAARLNIHASTVNWHAKRLQQAGILEPRRVGKEVQYHVNAGEVDKMLSTTSDVPGAGPARMM